MARNIIMVIIMLSIMITAPLFRAADFPEVRVRPVDASVNLFVLVPRSHLLDYLLGSALL